MPKRMRYAIESRAQSSRTESGWTKWSHYIVQPTLADAERVVASMAWWCKAERGELRIVDRERAGAGS